MKAMLDTSALNWLADHPGSPEELVAAREAGMVEILVTPEAAREIRNTTNSARRRQLEGVLSLFFPLTPTRTPRLGTMRLGLARLPTKRDEARVGAVTFLRDGPDRALVVNAAGYRCDAFVTADNEMAERKRVRLEAELDGTQVITPEDLMRRLRDLVRTRHTRAAEQPHAADGRRDGQG